ncbi:MAG: Lrp/AsnC family transcriptional regulator, leucine-responsive regulatory protein [Frankiaceae bacterium]|nr:Lrp/AsnC family transcriptional regulator, leucine-responsive regulatory protein [Frankiaceae bacterium]
MARCIGFARRSVKASAPPEPAPSAIRALRQSGPYGNLGPTAIWAAGGLPGSSRVSYGRRVEHLDREIVRLLAADGRRSFTDLARDTGLSVSALHQRVRRLEKRGVLRGYHAEVDPDEIDLPLTAFVSIKPIDPAAPDDAPDRLTHLTAIEACHSVAGDESYILKVRVATPAALEALLQEIRAAANVATRTTVVLSTPFEGRPPAI